MCPAKKRSDSGPLRVPPSDATQDTLERLVSRRSAQPQRGDVLLIRETVPSLKVTPTNRWRYRLATHPAASSEGRLFDNFSHAANEGESVASHRKTRLVYVEDDVCTLLNDYRGSR